MAWEDNRVGRRGTDHAASGRTPDARRGAAGEVRSSALGPIPAKRRRGDDQDVPMVQRRGLPCRYDRLAQGVSESGHTGEGLESAGLDGRRVGSAESGLIDVQRATPPSSYERFAIYEAGGMIG